MIPIVPVRATCVPPHADRSKSATSINRSVPSRPDSFRSGSRAASAASAKRIVTGRSPQTTRLASSSAAAASSAGHLTAKVDCRRLRAEVEALGPRAKHPVEGGRQHVLSGVLLHVIEPPRPIDRTVHGTGCDAAVKDVEDSPSSCSTDVEDPGSAERAGVERLTAGGRIESGAIEDDTGPAVRRRHTAHDAASNSISDGVVIVEALGHGVEVAAEQRVGGARFGEARGRAGGSCRSGRTACRPGRGS